MNARSPQAEAGDDMHVRADEFNGLLDPHPLPGALASSSTFLPFSAFNFRSAVAQVSEANQDEAKILIFVGLGVQTFMPLGVLTAIADRFASFVLAGYCIITALLRKQFWKQPDFSLHAKSVGREVFWDLLKNFCCRRWLLDARARAKCEFGFAIHSRTVERGVPNPQAPRLNVSTLAIGDTGQHGRTPAQAAGLTWGDR